MKIMQAYKEKKLEDDLGTMPVDKPAVLLLRLQTFRDAPSTSPYQPSMPSVARFLVAFFLFVLL